MSHSDFLPSYVGQRDDIIRLVPANVQRVLDVGCSVGAVGREIKRRRAAEVVGIELDAEMGSEARRHLDVVIIGDVETLDLDRQLQRHSFDCVILADVLEHLRDPWRVLVNCTEYLTDSGVLVASIPNVRHYTTVVSLLRGHWPYRERGIHDRTHLRFFALKNIQELFAQAGLRITQIHRKYRILERPHRVNRYSKYLAIGPVREFITFQYLVTAQSIGTDENRRLSARY